MNILHHLQSAFAVIVTFGLVIFLHEAGHFILCRVLGVRVERFAFGFGPELLGVTSEGTRFSICAFPLGGFVKPAGEDMEDCTGRKDEYYGQSWNRRLAIVAAGPAMNYLLAFTLFTGLAYFKGMPEAGDGPAIGDIVLGHPAHEAGLEVGDTVLSVAGRKVATWKDLADEIHKNPGKDIELVYLRGGKKDRLHVTPKKDEETGNGLIGIMPTIEFRPAGLAASAEDGLRKCWNLTAYTVKTIASKIYRRERPDLSGPVGIVQMVSRAAHSGIEQLVFLIGLISVAIGFFNILPVPLLDGGHAAFYLWEGLTGKKASKEAQARANGVGIAFLLSLLLFATYNDILRLRTERAVRIKAPAEAPKKD